MNDKTISMGKISYINASPVYYGLDHGLLPDWLTMVADVPSVLNHKLKTGQIEVSPISAAFYAMNHRDLLLLPDLSISCQGRVMSVILSSKYPIDDLEGKKIVFSQESASAASFLKMIFHQRNITPVYQVGDVNDFQAVSASADAVLVIGDAALIHPWEHRFEHCIDLGQLWYDMTQLPFVFAVWAVRRPFAQADAALAKEIHALLLASKDQGYEHIDTVIDAGERKLGIEKSRIKDYYDLLYCDLDDQKIKAMGLFFDSLYDQRILTERVDVSFL